MLLIYTNGWYLTAFLFLLGAWGLCEGAGPLRWTGPKNDVKDRSSTVVLWVLFLFGFVCSFLIPLWLPGSTFSQEDQPILFFFGCALVFLGGGLRWSAVRTLGKFFTTTIVVMQDHQVVQHGPYRIIRHPSYSGLVLITMGIGLMMTNWGSLIVLVLFLGAGLVNRIHVEEKALCLSLGAPYEEYRQQVPYRLLPFLY